LSVVDLQYASYGGAVSNNSTVTAREGRSENRPLKYAVSADFATTADAPITPEGTATRNTSSTTSNFVFLPSVAPSSFRRASRSAARS